MKSDPHLIAVGAVCSTRVYRVRQVPDLPAKVLPEAAVEITDGMAVSAACAFVKLGGTAELWARVGDDERGRLMEAELRAAGIDVDHLKRIPGVASSHACVVVDMSGDRLVIPYHDPVCDPSPDWLPLERLTPDSFLLCDVRWPDGAEAALKAAASQGCMSMLDADIAPLSVLERLVPQARLVVFSDQALRFLSGEADIESALSMVSRRYGCEVGVSCGRDGYFWLEAGHLHHVPAPKLEIVDTLSAGDVLHGVLALALSEGRSMQDAATFAVAAATLKCTSFGGRLGCPSRAEVESFLTRAQVSVSMS